MRVGKRLALALVTAAGAIAVFALSGAPAAAQEEHPPPVHPAPCTWTVDKTASLHSAPNTPITSLNLSLGQTITVQYDIVVTRTCEEGFDPTAEGGSANVIDSYAGVLAIHLFLDDLHPFATETFTYTRDITAETCDPFTVDNTVDVIDSDPANPFASDSASIDVTVHCDEGCTLTQGYWKTHSEFGPAPYDNTWAQLPNGASTTFFLSGKTWFQVFWTPPAGGNVYYQLAHQYMAAVLNKLNGASSTAAVDAAIASATTFFNTYTPAQAGAFAKNSAARSSALALASTLASYNEGDIGPGHCDE